MRIDRRTFVKTSSLAALSLAAPAIIGRAAADDHIKLVSILDQSGGLDIYGKPMVDATTMAVDEINAAGGLAGRQVELINYDPQSTIQFYTQYATQAAAGDKADVVHAGITSASREAIRPTLGRFNTLYFYNTQYEGGVCDRNCFCTGSTPAQTVEKLVPYAMNKWGKKVYIVAADYNYGQITAQWVRNTLPTMAAKWPTSSSSPSTSPISAHHQEDPGRQARHGVVGACGRRPHVVLPAVCRRRHEQVRPRRLHHLALGNEHKLISPRRATACLVAYSYFQEVDTPDNHAFVKRFQDKFGADSPYLNELADAQLRGHHAVGGSRQEGGHRRAHGGDRGARERHEPRRPQRPSRSTPRPTTACSTSISPSCRTRA
jgi:urea transport system substrate-binding protein